MVLPSETWRVISQNWLVAYSSASLDASQSSWPSQRLDGVSDGDRVDSEASDSFARAKRLGRVPLSPILTH